MRGEQLSAGGAAIETASTTAALRITQCYTSVLELG